MADEREFRKLTAAEIELLESNGCRCDGWNNILVSGTFSPESYRQVIFSGKIRLGKADGQRKDKTGITFRAKLDHYMVTYSHNERIVCGRPAST